MPTINRWSLEPVTYNIKFKWILGAHNKAADSLSRSVDVKDTPATTTALINILVTSTPDGPATHTLSKTLNTTNLTSTDTTPTSINDIVNTPPTLTADRNDTLKCM